MRVLLATHHLLRPGGTERHTETLYHALRRRGHAVDVLALAGNKLFPAPEYDPAATYDLACINHHPVLARVLEGKRPGCVVFTSHGVIPDLERPGPGADRYAAVSEEVQEALAEQGYPADVIPNPLDLARFRATRPVSPTLRRVLFLSTHQGRALAVVERACALAGVELDVMGKGPSAQRDPAEAINAADLVIGLGRSAVEALACRRNVVVFDYRGGDGFVFPGEVGRLARRNFSGRTFGRWFTPEELAAEFAHYDPAQDVTAWVAARHDADAVAGRYLSYIHVDQPSAL